MRYIKQGKYAGWSCALIALLNALRHFDQETVYPDHPDWKLWTSALGCNSGPMLRNVVEVADILGMNAKPVDPDDVKPWTPTYLHTWNPEPIGSALHAVFCLHHRPHKKEYTVVNYHWLNGPIIWAGTPKFPGKNTNIRTGYELSLK